MMLDVRAYFITSKFTVILDPTVDGKQEEQPELPLSKTGYSDFFDLNFLLTFLLVFLFVV